jgi:glycosidase
MRGIPQFFYGTEILMTSPKRRDDGKVRSDFPGGWAGDTVNAFSGQGLSPYQREAQQFMRRLLNWRKSATVIHTGRLMHFAPENGTYVYFRYNDSKKVMVVFNKNSSQVTLDLARFGEILAPQSSATEVLSGQKLSLSKSLTVPARSVMLLDFNNN